MSDISEAVSIMHETLGSLTQDMDAEDRVRLYDVLISSLKQRRADAMAEDE